MNLGYNHPALVEAVSSPYLKVILDQYDYIFCTRAFAILSEALAS